ncbi:hypothetical protein PCC7424_4403 [Gloeothece citriformis PCC 7424]|uniref:Uncharacterized protein n=1 Tax=Gloeothece citriformis (strain PCC 7424) TaxID=65393 RepID=B7K8Z8_GLOC7|nr:hypothetical protein [Gloeothece citriformis]ACK72767.1 hypothetical protein PCC7424_4403 [Gloeothece citriformis PCC 7424]
MFLIDIFFAFTIATVLTLIFSVGLRRTGPWDNVIIFFIVLFLSTWAGGLWIIPLATPLWGGNWLIFLYTGLIIALLLAVTTPKPSSTTEIKTQRNFKAQKKTTSALKVFFWVWIILLVMAITISYLT